MKKKDLLIIIPAYNEEANIEPVLDALEAPEISSVADVLVMNDNSSDRTSIIAKERNYPVVSHVFNLGYGSGLHIGYKFAIRRGYSYVIQMDADGQHDVSNVMRIYKELKTPDENGNYPDIILGSRFVEGASEFPVSTLKKFAFWLFRGMIKLGTGQKIMDPTTGLQGLSRRMTLFYSQFNHFDDRYPDANMIMQSILLGFYVREIPATMHTRSSGTSMHSGLKPAIYMIWMFFSILATEFRIKVLKWNVGVTDEPKAKA